MHLPTDVIKCDKVHVPGSASSDALSCTVSYVMSLRKMAQFTYVVITISHSSGAVLELTQHCFLHRLIWKRYCTSTSCARVTLLFLGDD